MPKPENKKWYAFTTPDQSGTLECYIYGVIGEQWNQDGDNSKDITQANFVADLIAAGPTVKSINMHVNSGGGDVFEALGIYNFLRAKGYSVNTTVEGLAASAASVLCMTGKCTMASNSILMFHEPFTGACGNADELARASEQLRTIQDAFAGIYAQKSKQPVAKIQALMSDQTPITAAMAKEMGFCDEISDPVDIAASLNPARTPKIAAKVPQFFASLQTKETDMTAEQIQKLKDDERAAVRAEISTFKAEFGEMALDYLEKKLPLADARAEYAKHLKAKLSESETARAALVTENTGLKNKGVQGFVTHDPGDGAQGATDDDKLLVTAGFTAESIRAFAKTRQKSIDDVRAMLLTDIKAEIKRKSQAK